jgi:hypothetical protein
LFTERREIVQVTDSAQIKDRLMNTLRTITQAQAQDVDDTAAASLLAELAGPAIEPETIDAGPELVELEPVEPGPANVLSMRGGAHPPPPARQRIFGSPPSLVFRTLDHTK